MCLSGRTKYRMCKYGHEGEEIYSDIEQEVIREIDGYLINLEEAYGRIDSLYINGFTREYFDDRLYKDYPKPYMEDARFHYDILGNEISILGRFLAEAREYIKELQDDKDKSKLQ